jgi:hypothetical protein
MIGKPNAARIAVLSRIGQDFARLREPGDGPDVVALEVDHGAGMAKPVQRGKGIVEELVRPWIDIGRGAVDLNCAHGFLLEHLIEPKIADADFNRTDVLDRIA